MAAYFASVLAVDVEPEMIAAGRDEASRRGVKNIAWLVERAEDLELAAASIDLITIGEAFHRLDQKRILERARRWLRPGGALATLGGEPIWRGEEHWKQAVVEVVNRWTAGSRGNPDQQLCGGPSDELRTAGFEVEEHESVVERTWTCDSIVGFMFSTSVASHRALKGRGREFEADLRRALLEVVPSDRFRSMQKFSFTLGRLAM